MKKLIIILSISLALILSVSLFYRLHHSNKYVDVDNETRQTYINYLNKQVSQVDNLTSQEIRAMLEDELNFHFYIYREGKISNPKESAISYLFVYIKVDPVKSYNTEKYVIDLCHEMCHIKYFTSNEIYTNFMTFKTLYESDNETLKNIGTWFGIYILNKCYTQSYDCSQLIINYLNFHKF